MEVSEGEAGDRGEGGVKKWGVTSQRRTDAVTRGRRGGGTRGGW